MGEPRPELHRRALHIHHTRRRVDRSANARQPADVRHQLLQGDRRHHNGRPAAIRLSSGLFRAQPHEPVVMDALSHRLLPAGLPQPQPVAQLDGQRTRRTRGLHRPRLDLPDHLRRQLHQSAPITPARPRLCHPPGRHPVVRQPAAQRPIATPRQPRAARRRARALRRVCHYCLQNRQPRQLADTLPYYQARGQKLGAADPRTSARYVAEMAGYEPLVYYCQGPARLSELKPLVGYEQRGAG